MTLETRDRACLWHPFTALGEETPNIAIERGQGALLFDTQGRSYIDAISSWWVNLHGHAEPRMAEAVAEQARHLEHVIFAGFTHEPGVLLAEELIKVLPANISKIFYSDNGSTAVEVALKMAIQYWSNLFKPRDTIVALSGGYHGDTFGAMSVAERSIYNKPFWPYLFKVEYLPLPTEADENKAVSQFEALLNSSSVAAIIYEPLVQGASGMRLYSAQGLDRLLSLAATHGVIRIADEVMTGFGRTGPLFASEQLQVKPDIICLSKGLTGGMLPLGVSAVSSRLVDAFSSVEKEKVFLHGHSYTGNPLACRAGLTSLELLLDVACSDSRTRIEKAHRNFATQLRDRPNIKNVGVLGTLLRFEIESPDGSEYFNKVRQVLYPFYLDKGVLLRPIGNVIYVLPPYCIRDSELETIYSVISASLDFWTKHVG